MRNRAALSIGLLLLAMPWLLAGCGSGVGNGPLPPPDHADRVKKMLSGMAETGDRSVLPFLRAEVTQLKNAGDTQAAALLADVDKLEKTTNPAEFKALAAKVGERVVVSKPPESP